MIIVNNPYRAYEDVLDCWKEMSSFSSNFANDFRGLIDWCARNGRIDRYHRQEFGMSAEPYGADLPEYMSADERIEALTNHAMSVVEPALNHWQWLYQKLRDWDSKVLLLTVVAYRCLGWRYVRMPLDTPAFWSCMDALSEVEKDGPALGASLQKLSPYPMGLFDLSEDGAELKIYSNAFGVFNEFVYSQYTLRSRDGVTSPKAGDVVLDCGACYGGTSLQFAKAVGDKGTVVAYEFMPGNVEIFKENMRLNPQLARSVRLMERPVWHETGASMSVEGSGPATQVFIDEPGHAPASSAQKFASITIDETVKVMGLPRVDFIKMDIEGAEMMALRGARRTIERDRPNMAICVYHKLIDFYEIPQFIDSLGLGYVFNMQHSTVHGDETVVFATVNERERAVSKFWPASNLRWLKYKYKSKIRRLRR